MRPNGTSRRRGCPDLAVRREGAVLVFAQERHPFHTDELPQGAKIDLVGYVDEGVRADARISFAAGSHRYSVRVDRAAWEQAAELAYAAFGVRRRSPCSVRERGWT
jgi:hypothetical protein